jgi:hypothetical protein
VVFLGRKPELGHQAEIEQDDTSRACDEHVGGLDVAMELSGGVQSADSGGSLAQRRSQTVGVEAR